MKVTVSLFPLFVCEELIVFHLVGKTGEEDMAEEETMEHLELLVVNAVEPFRVEYDVMYAHSSLPAPSFAPSGKRTTEGWVGLADLTTFDASWRDERGEGAVEALVCGTVFIGNREEQRGEERMIVVEKIELERTVCISFACIDGTVW